MIVFVYLRIELLRTIRWRRHSCLLCRLLYHLLARQLLAIQVLSNRQCMIGAVLVDASEGNDRISARLVGLRGGE